MSAATDLFMLEQIAFLYFLSRPVIGRCDAAPRSAADPPPPALILRPGLGRCSRLLFGFVSSIMSGVPEAVLAAVVLAATPGRRARTTRAAVRVPCMPTSLPLPQLARLAPIAVSSDRRRWRTPRPRRRPASPVLNPHPRERYEPKARGSATRACSPTKTLTGHVLHLHHRWCGEYHTQNMLLGHMSL